MFDPNEGIYEDLANFIKDNGWNEVGVIQDRGNGQVWEPLTNDLANHFERNNISILCLAETQTDSLTKIPHQENLNASVEALVENDARIIIIHSLFPWHYICQMDHQGLINPYHIVLLNIASYNDPMFYSRPSGCSRESLVKALNYVFIFDRGIFPLYQAKWAFDSFGMSGERFDNELLARIDGFESSSLRSSYMRTICYDQLTTAGYILEETEKRLRLMNQTLIDFKHSWKSVRDVMLSSLPNVDFRGLISEINFKVDNKSSLVTRAKTTFYQFRNLRPVPVAFYDKNEHKVVEAYFPIQWMTPDNKPPKSKQSIEIRFDDPIPLVLVWLVIAVNSLTLVVATGFGLGMILFKRNSILRIAPFGYVLKLIQLFGVVSLSISGLLLPMDFNDVTDAKCNAFIIFCISGIFLVAISTLAWLEKSLNYFIHRLLIKRQKMELEQKGNEQNDQSKQEKPVEHRPEPIEMKTMRKMDVVICILSTIVISLVVSFALKRQTAVMDIEMIDRDIFHVVHIRSCDYNVSSMRKYPFAIAILLVIVNVLVQLRGGFLALYLRNVS